MKLSTLGYLLHIISINSYFGFFLKNEVIADLPAVKDI
ncbi:hypothetical protein C1A50_0786 [Paenibacillus polymyxa]|nr:hypothetical protein C1A50_0786 [Paenibacillus polymyxa]